MRDYIICKMGQIVIGNSFSFLAGFFGFEISVVEESGKQNKVRDVHQKAELDIGVADLTFQAVLFHLVGPEIDQAAYHHLG